MLRVPARPPGRPGSRSVTWLRTASPRSGGAERDRRRLGDQPEALRASVPHRGWVPPTRTPSRRRSPSMTRSCSRISGPTGSEPATGSPPGVGPRVPYAAMPRPAPVDAPRPPVGDLQADRRCCGWAGRWPWAPYAGCRVVPVVPVHEAVAALLAGPARSCSPRTGRNRRPRGTPQRCGAGASSERRRPASPGRAGHWVCSGVPGSTVSS